MATHAPRAQHASSGPSTDPSVNSSADEPGSRWESMSLALKLAGDLLSMPFHIAAFVFTRGRQRQALLDELREAAR